MFAVQQNNTLPISARQGKILHSNFVRNTCVRKSDISTGLKMSPGNDDELSLELYKRKLVQMEKDKQERERPLI